MHTRNIRRKTPVTLLAASIGLALYVPSSFAQEAAAAQDAASQASGAATDLDTIVVTGYRASLERAIGAGGRAVSTLRMPGRVA